MATCVDRFCANLLENKNLANVSEERFVWRTGHVKKPGAEQYYSTNIKVNEKMVRMDKIFFFLEDTQENTLRNALEPVYDTTFHFRCLSITTPFVYVARLLYRLVELVTIFSAVFFRTFLELYRENPEEDFAMKFTIEIKKHMRQLKRNFYQLGSKIKTDMRCAVVMEVAALRGQFSSDAHTITRMMVYFSRAEYKWNEGVTVRENALNRYRKFMKKYFSHPNDYNIYRFLEGIFSIATKHNRGFMTYECAYPLPQDYRNRVAFIHDFPSYEAAVAWQKKKNKEAKGP